MGRKRRRRSSSCNRRGFSRRTYLAGGFLFLGSGLLVTDSNAFSSVSADRSTSVGVTSGENALVGLDIVSSLEAGKSAQSLMTVSNNTDVELLMSVSLRNPSQGSLSPDGTTLGVGESASFSASVASDSQTGEDAFAFDITATDSENLTVSMTRRVAVSSSPTLNWAVDDRTSNSSARYDVTYQVLHVENFERIDIRFESTDQSWASGTETSTQSEGTLTYEEGGAVNHTYEITFVVYDGSNDPVIEETVTDVADGTDPSDNDEISGGSDDPILESFTVTDDTQNNNTNFTLNYEVLPRDNFQYVRVRFNNTNKDWADKTKTNSNAPSGTVTNAEGGVEGDIYEITVETVNQNGIVTDSGNVSVQAGSNETRTYP